MLQLTKTAALTGILVVLLGCERDTESGQPAQDLPAAVPAANNELIVGTPKGDVEEWIADVQTALDSVSAGLTSAPDAVHRQVLDLYVTRQEYIEMYYGPGGRMTPTRQLSDAVKLAETRFHELMRLTGATPPAATSEINKGIVALKAQYRTVLKEAKQTPKHLREVARSAQ